MAPEQGGAGGLRRVAAGVSRNNETYRATSGLAGALLKLGACSETH
jgi:hypothetical protein